MAQLAMISNTKSPAKGKAKAKGNHLRSPPMFRMSSKASVPSQRLGNAAVGRLT